MEPRYCRPMIRHLRSSFLMSNRSRQPPRSLVWFRNESFQSRFRESVGVPKSNAHPTISFRPFTWLGCSQKSSEFIKIVENLNLSNALGFADRKFQIEKIKNLPHTSRSRMCGFRMHKAASFCHGKHTRRLKFDLKQFSFSKSQNRLLCLGVFSRNDYVVVDWDHQPDGSRAWSLLDKTFRTVSTELELPN